jgi:hypothetical protein
MALYAQPGVARKYIFLVAYDGRVCMYIHLPIVWDVELIPIDGHIVAGALDYGYRWLPVHIDAGAHVSLPDQGPTQRILDFESWQENPTSCSLDKMGGETHPIDFLWL